MRAMCTHGELELEEEFVGRALGIAGPPELRADLAELAGPIGQHQGTAGILQSGVIQTLGTVETRAKEPAASKLIISGNVESVRGCHGMHRLLGMGPDELAASDERVVNGAAQRFPSHGCVDSIWRVDKRVG